MVNYSNNFPNCFVILSHQAHLTAIMTSKKSPQTEKQVIFNSFSQSRLVRVTWMGCTGGMLGLLLPITRASPPLMFRRSMLMEILLLRKSLFS